MKNKRIVLILILSLFLLFPGSSGAKLSKLGTVTMSMVTGTAFMNDSAQSWTGYTSIVGQPKQFRVKVIDGTGKVATGWIGELGTGETLGDELVVNGTFTLWTGDNPDGWGLSFTEDADNYATQNPAGQLLMVSHAPETVNVYITQVIIFNGMLCKHSIDIKSISGDPGYRLNFHGTYYTTPGVKTGYHTNTNNILVLDPWPYIDITIDDVSIKQVLTPTTNGVWIHPSKTSAATGWESIQTGFNANSIASYETISTSVVPGKTRYAYPKNQTGLVGEWSLSSGSKVGSDYSGRGGDDLFTPVGSPTAADGFDGETNGALSFNGTSQYLTQKVYYNETNDDAELTGVLTDGLATVTINDSDSMGTAYDRRGGTSPWMIVATDSGAAVVWGYMGVNTFSTPSNTFQIYTTKTGTTQNWNKPTGTFSFANTPIIYRIKKTDFQLSGALTMGAWVKNNAPGVGYDTIIGKRGANSSSTYQIYIETGTARFAFYDGIQRYSTYIIPANTWVFLAVVVNTNVSFYVNGVFVNSADGTIGPENEASVVIGNIVMGEYVLSEYFNGSIDSPFIYSRALSSTEVYNLYRTQFKTKITQIYNLDSPSYFTSLPGIKEGDFKKWFVNNLDSDKVCYLKSANNECQQYQMAINQ